MRNKINPYPNWKIPSLTVDKRGNALFNNYSKKDLARLKYLAKRQGRNLKGYLTQGLLAYIRKEKDLIPN